MMLMVISRRRSTIVIDASWAFLMVWMLLINPSRCGGASEPIKGDGLHDLFRELMNCVDNGDASVLEKACYEPLTEENGRS